MDFLWFLPDGFPPGSRVIIKGIPALDTSDKSFAINFLSKLPYDEGNIAYHASFRYGEKYLINNSFVVSKGFQDQERYESLPLSVGKPFEIVIMCETTHFTLYINGNHFSNFRHRMFFETIKYLTIVGGVKVTSMLVERMKFVNWPLPFGFQEGDKIIISGFPGIHSWSDEFNIRLQNFSPNNELLDIPFSMTVRFKEGKIINNAYEFNAWGKEEIQEISLERGKRFQIIISRGNFYFKVNINDKEFVYNLRTNNKVKCLTIRGHVDISSVEITSAMVELKKTTPNHD